MTASQWRTLLPWTTLVPAAALVALLASWGRTLSGPVLAVEAVLLIGAVMAAVHHAETIAHRIGEPFGSLVLAVAVTVIEVGLIVMLMVGATGDTSTLARDTVFSAVMLTMNGIVGLSLMVGAVKYRWAVFNPEGTGAALATVVALAVVALVLPHFTTSNPGPIYTTSQLAFAGVASLALYGSFVFTQTIRHRDFFLPPHEVAQDIPSPCPEPDDAPKRATDDSDDGEHAQPPTVRQTMLSVVLLLVALVAVVGLAKTESPAIEVGLKFFGLPPSFVGVVLAMVVLLPESIAAVRAAAQNRTQISLNLGYGSAMASIGLTIPTMAVASIWLPGTLKLGLDPVQLVLLATSAIVSVLTVVPGRAKTLHAVVHLILLAAFVFFSVVP